MRAPDLMRETAEYHAGFLAGEQSAGTEIVDLRREMRRLVSLLDGECVLPDGSNADTRHAHWLLGDIEIGESGHDHNF